MAGRLERYIVFAGDSYYPEGGALDIAGSYPDLDSALAWTRGTPERVSDLEDGMHWCHVVDSETGLIVAYNEGMLGGSLTDSEDRMAPDAVNLRTASRSAD